jgi:hypothetical protein
LVSPKVDFQAVRDRTIGTVFFGTPHKGSKFANLGDILGFVGKATFWRDSKPAIDLIRSLKRGAPELASDTAGFVGQSKDLKFVISCYENMPIKLPRWFKPGYFNRSFKTVVCAMRGYSYFAAEYLKTTRRYQRIQLSSGLEMERRPKFPG